jgi:hypothetical protein
LGVLMRAIEQTSSKYEWETHVRFVPLAVWCSINQNDGALDESVRADKLVVRGIVDLALIFNISS